MGQEKTGIAIHRLISARARRGGYAGGHRKNQQPAFRRARGGA
jgi:hypothetical protein